MLRRCACLAAFCVASASLLAAVPGPAERSCGEGTPLASMEVEVAGRDRVGRSVAVPANAHLLISAREAGIDVILAVPAANLAADNPTPRWGPQRIALDSGRVSKIELELIGKEHAGARGQVRVDVVAFSDVQYSGACVTAERLLASGDSHFAMPQLIALGLKSGDSVAAREHYEAAIRDYRRAAEVAEAATLARASAAGAPARSTEADALLEAAAHARLATGGAIYQALALLADPGPNRLTWKLASEEIGKSEREFQQSHDDYGRARARAARAAADMESALSAAFSSGAGSSGPALLASARATLDEVARFHERRGEFFDSGVALNNIGLAFDYEGRFAESIRAYLRAQPVFARIHERTREAQVLQNIALVQSELGQFPEALESFAKVVELLEERDDPQLFADVLNNRALAEYGSRDLDAALRDYGAALEILIRLNSTRQESRSLNGIGAVYYASGDLEQAEQYFSRALELRTAAADPRGRIQTLRASANVLRDLGRFADALKLRNEALGLADASKPMRARVRIQAVRDLAALGRSADAFEMIRLALEESAGGDEGLTAQALMERSRLNLAALRLDAARADAAQALRTFRAREMPVDEFDALLMSARIARARGRPLEAMVPVDRAIALAERVRIQSANPELRAGLWGSVRPAFELKIDLLAQLSAPAPGASAGATAATLSTSARSMLQTAEESRGRALADYERLTEDLAADPQRRASEQHRNDLYRQIAVRRFRLDGYLDRGLEKDAHVAAIRADIGALEREVDVLNASLAATPGTRRASRSAGSGMLESLVSSMPDDAAAIEYWLGDSEAYAWVVTNQGVQRVNLGATGRIDAAALAMFRSFSGTAAVSAEGRVELSQQLYRLIIEPLPPAARRARVQTFVADGALHYVPFAALASIAKPTPRFLIDEHDVAVTPSLGALAHWGGAARRRFAKDMLLIADPVYSTADARLGAPGRVEPLVAAPASQLAIERISRAVPGGITRGKSPARLPGAEQEASAIAGLFASDRLDRLEGFDASRDAFLARDLTSYRYIHIAAHGVGDARSPKFSELVLSTVNRQGQPIPGEVFAGDLALRRMDAEVVVLSSCETALGPATAGEGLLGLRYAAHAGGARSVVASLWQAPDVTAALVMSRFYERMMKREETPRVALANAMRTVRARYTDPLLWGAFEISVTADGFGSSIR